jgi:hypothetical protein
MKRFFSSVTTFKAVMVGVIINGMATACQNGDSPVGNLLQQDAAISTLAQQEKNGVRMQNSKRPSEAEARVVNQQLENVSKAIALLVSDNGSATLLHSAAMKKFDGVTNVLWKTLDAEKSFGKGLSAALVDKNTNKAAAEFVSERALQAAMQHIESKFGANLHLFWYNAEKWNGKTSPIIVFTPVDKDPEKAAFLPGYDAKGNEYQVDKKFADTHVVVVLTFNERTDLNGNVKAGIQVSTPIGKQGATTQAASYMTITQLRFKHDANWYEGWFGGDGEFRVVSYEPGGTILLGTADFFNVTRYTMDQYQYQVLNVNNPLKAANIGTSTQVQWWELDDAIGEWGFGDDNLGTFQVSPGTSNLDNQDIGATYLWP